MDINAATLKAFFTALKTSFNQAFGGVTADWQKIAFTVPSSTSVTTYAWMNELPKLREWIGARVMRRISETTYSIRNKKWEDTIVVPRDTIEDDEHGIYSPLASELGRATAEHPGELVWEQLKNGFTTLCYDGQNFFDTEHPVINPETSDAEPVSNMQDGAGAPWFILDTSRAIKPIIFQERRKPEFVSMTDANNEHVFKYDEFVYGVSARYNVGVSFWQLAYASKAELNQANLRAARNAMKQFKSDEGRLLGVKPMLLVVGVGNADVARDLIKAERLEGGKSNTDRDIIEILEVPFLD